MFRKSWGCRFSVGICFGFHFFVEVSTWFWVKTTFLAELFLAKTQREVDLIESVGSCVRCIEAPNKDVHSKGFVLRRPWLKMFTFTKMGTGQNPL